MARKNKTENDSRLLKNSDGNRHGERNLFPGNEADIASFVQVTRMRKIRKNLRSKLVTVIAPNSVPATNLMKHRNNFGSKSTNQKARPLQLRVRSFGMIRISIVDPRSLGS